jgi:hypothetical protein
VNFLDHLIEVHSSWFKSQGTSDRFARVLNLDPLKQTSGSPFLSPSSVENEARTQQKNLDQMEIGTGLANSENEPGAEAVGWIGPGDVAEAEREANEHRLDPEDIRALQGTRSTNRCVLNIIDIDILACSRVEAIHLLVENGGDLGNALAVLFS